MHCQGHQCFAPEDAVHLLYTNTADQYRQNLDYVLVKHRFRNSIKNVVTLHVAVIYCDSNLLDAKFCTGMKKLIKLQKENQECGEIIAQRQKVEDLIEEIVLHSDVKVGLWKCSEQ